MKCQKCGATLNPNDTFCMACGELIEDVVADTEIETTQPILVEKEAPISVQEEIKTPISAPMVDTSINSFNDVPNNDVNNVKENEFTQSSIEVPKVNDTITPNQPVITPNDSNALSFDAPVDNQPIENTTETINNPGPEPVFEALETQLNNTPATDQNVDEVVPQAVTNEASANSIGSMNLNQADTVPQAPVFNGFEENNDNEPTKVVNSEPETFYTAAVNNVEVNASSEVTSPVVDEKVNETVQAPTLMNSPQDDIIPADNELKPKKKSLISVFIIIVLIIVVIMGGVVYYLYFIKGNDTTKDTDNSSSSMVDEESSTSGKIVLSGYSFTIPSDYTVIVNPTNITLSKLTKTIIISYLSNNYEAYTAADDAKTALTDLGYTIAKTPLTSTISEVKYYVIETTLQTQKRLLAYTKAPDDNMFKIELYDNTANSYSYSELSYLAPIFKSVK